MTQDLWLNLPVRDLPRAIAFFTAIGFVPKPGPGNTAHSASFQVGSNKVILMLFTETLFSSFTNHALADTATGSEVLFSLGARDRAEVDALAAKVEAAGGTVFARPRESNGFLYGCGFCDPDGHRWNALHMDTARVSG